MRFVIIFFFIYVLKMLCLNCDEQFDVIIISKAKIGFVWFHNLNNRLHYEMIKTRVEMIRIIIRMKQCIQFVMEYKKWLASLRSLPWSNFLHLSPNHHAIKASDNIHTQGLRFLCHSIWSIENLITWNRHGKIMRNKPNLENTIEMYLLMPLNWKLLKIRLW